MSHDSDVTDEGLRAAYQRSVEERGEGDASVSIEEMEALVQGLGTEGERLATLNRVMRDPKLRREFELLRATAVAAESPADRGWLRSPLLKAAAVAVVALGLGSLWWQLNPAPDRLRTANDQVDLLAPEDGAVVDTPARFLWHSVAEARSYRIQVLTTDGEVAVDATLADTLFVPADTLTWTAGEHIWWVTAEVTGGQEVSAAPRRLRIGPPGRPSP